MKATGLQDPFPALPDDPDERPAITQDGGSSLRPARPESQDASCASAVSRSGVRLQPHPLIGIPRSAAARGGPPAKEG